MDVRAGHIFDSRSGDEKLVEIRTMECGCWNSMRLRTLLEAGRSSVGKVRPRGVGMSLGLE